MSDPDSKWKLDFIKHIEGMEKPFWEPIGQYVFQFGMLEREIDRALSRLMGVPYEKVGKYVAFELDFLTRVHLIKAFSRKRTFEEAVANLAKELEDQNTFRNSLVHGAWTAHVSGDRIESGWQKLGLSRRHNLKAFNVTCSEIMNAVQSIERLGREISQISELARSEAVQPPSPDKSG